MPVRAPSTRPSATDHYTPTAKLLHWLMAAVLAVVWTCGILINHALPALRVST